MRVCFNVFVLFKDGINVWLIILVSVGLLFRVMMFNIKKNNVVDIVFMFIGVSVCVIVKFGFRYELLVNNNSVMSFIDNYKFCICNDV